MSNKNITGLNPDVLQPTINQLNGLLADCQVYYTNLRGLHWNILGDKFFELHELYEEYYDELAETIDEIAERIAMLGATPENRYSAYLKTSEVKELHNVTDWEAGVNHVIETTRLLMGKSRELLKQSLATADAGTASLAQKLVKECETRLWKLTAYMG